MPSFTVPISVRPADPDPSGPIRRLVSARVPVQVEVAPGRFVGPPPFVLDTGATYTTMSTTLARSRGIPFPTGTSRVAITTAAGIRGGLVRDGELRVRFLQLPDRVFRLYCVFAEDVPPSVPPVFGLNDFLDVFRVTLDGAPRLGAPFGSILFETLI
ncbi:MAG TPA: aspartyl protease family protein [Fimbriiglobus sp.]|nr:aspartyl protease family protein [Fimbriiglobus sp.]